MMRRVGRAVTVALATSAACVQAAAADPLVLSCALDNGAEPSLYRIEPRGAWQTWRPDAHAWTEDACNSVRMECERGRNTATQLQVIGGAVGARAYRRVTVNFRTNEYRIETWADRMLNRIVREGMCTPAAEPN